MTEDLYCMECGSKLDPITGKCPKCEPVLAETAESGQGEVPTKSGEKDQYPPGGAKKAVDTMSQSQSADIKPETTQSSSPAPPPPPPVSKPSRPAKKPLVVKIIAGIVLAIVVIFVVLMVIGFLVGPSEDASNIVGEETASMAYALIPSPTDTFSPGTEVYIQVEKDPIDNSIHVTFSGGPGQKVLKMLQATVYRSDGGVLDGTLPPEIRESLTLQGSTGDDRVEVFAVYLSGNRYRIYDQVLKQRARN